MPPPPPSPASARAKALRTSKDDPKNFVSGFFQQSRLHYIGAWRERYQEILDALPPEIVAAMAEPPPPIPLPPPLPTSSAAASSSSSACGSGRKQQSWPDRPQRVIFHLDMDCFFARSPSSATTGSRRSSGSAAAAAGGGGGGGGGGAMNKHQSEKQLLDLIKRKRGSVPLAVCHSRSESGSAEVSSCTYPARAKGVTKGMFIGEAKSRCPSSSSGRTSSTNTRPPRPPCTAASSR